MVNNPQTEERPSKIGRRGASRLKIHLPSKLETISGRQSAVIQDVSQTGAGLRLQTVPRVNADVILTFAKVEAFSNVVWTNKNSAGLKFYTPLSLEQVLVARAEGEMLPIKQRRELAGTAKAWCLGVYS
jgi:hypothetical protein